jgi:hypothetical protein
MKFTFKTIQPTGRYRSFDHPYYEIKLKKVCIGSIDPEKPFKIRLQVTKSDINEDGNLNCPWKWIQLKKESSSLQEAKDFLNAHFESITTKYKIHLSE